MRYLFILILIFILFSQSAFKPPQKTLLSFKTSTGNIIKVTENAIRYNNRDIFKIEYPTEIITESKSNRIVEDHGTIFLFIAMFGGPNLDRLKAYEITPYKATLKVDAILSPIKDYDADGYLEFGGRDLTEFYPNTDSMYYVPTAYYEIKDGKIHPDNSLTRSKDIEINGLYIPYNKQLDKDGSCCVVIPKPKQHSKKN